MNPIVDRILHEVKKVIVGKDEVLEKILMAFISQGHVLLDDVPGTGKTTAALAFSRALGCSIPAYSLRRMCCRRISSDFRYMTNRRGVSSTIRVR